MTYKVKLVSQTNSIVLVVIGLTGVFVSAGTLLPKDGLQNRGLSTIIVIGIAVIGYVLWQVFVTGRTIWTIDENEIKIAWTKKFFLGDCEDEIIKWDEIKDISRGADTRYYNLKIELTADYTIKYFHDIFTTRDDFENMLKTLYQTFRDKKAIANNTSSKAGLTQEQSATNRN